MNGNTVAVFENGTVYAGGSTWGIVLGYYGGGRIEDEYRKTVARYSAGTAYALDSFDPVLSSGSSLCHCSGTTIYEGGNSWNDMLGNFTGDIGGACAAAILYFSLHTKTAIAEHRQDGLSSNENDAPRVDWSAFWGGLIVAALCLLMIYIFWFTDTGREMLFGESEGMFTFMACVLSAIIGSYKIYKQDNLRKWKDIVGTSAQWYFVALVLTWIMGIVTGIADDMLSFGNCLVVLFLSPIIVVGAAAPIFAVQVLVLICIKKRIFNCLKGEKIYE